MAFSLKRLHRCFSAHFAEEVVYRPAKGPPRRIMAVVDRQIAAAIGDGRAVNYVVIEVDNDASTGIVAAEIDTGGDRIDLPSEVDGTVEQRSLGIIITQDEGRLQLEIR